MADELIVVGGGGHPKRLRDMGDGSWAEVVYAVGSSGGVQAAGENHIGEVGGNSKTVSPALVLTTGSAYAVGNVLGGLTAGGDGRLPLTGALRASPNTRFTGVLQSALGKDIQNLKPGIDLLIFNSQPSASYIDKATPSTMSAADAAKLIRRIPIAAADWVTSVGIAVADLGNISKVVEGTSADLYLVVILTATTPNYSAAGNLLLNFGFLRD